MEAPIQTAQTAAQRSISDLQKIVGGYLRVSRVAFPPECQTPEEKIAYVDTLRQIRKAELEKDAAQQGQTITQWYDDLGVSGRGEFIARRLSFSRARKFGKGDGQGRVNFEVAREALRQGHSLTLIATEVAAEFQQHPAVAWVPIPIRRWPTALLKGQVFARKSARWLRTHRRDVDIVQVNGFITWAASDVNAVHFVHSAWAKSPVHTGRLRRGPYGLYQRLYTALNARLERRAFRQAGTVVAVSERVKSELTAIGVPAERVQVIINGVDLTEFAPGPASRETLGLPGGVPLALFAGDIRTPRKNLDTTLKALVSVPDLHLAVAGATAGSPYPALCTRLGLDDRVHFLGFRRDMAALMQAADFFVFPSRYEACSLVLLEALASGLPVITAETAGGAEVVTPDCGIVLPDPDDVSALTAAMSALTLSAERRRQMSRAARTVAEQHSWAGMASAYLDVCRHEARRSEDFGRLKKANA